MSKIVDVGDGLICRTYVSNPSKKNAYLHCEWQLQVFDLDTSLSFTCYQNAGYSVVDDISKARKLAKELDKWANMVEKDLEKIPKKKKKTLPKKLSF